MRGGQREGERMGEGSGGYGTDIGEDGAGGGERKEIRRDEKKN